MNKPTSSKLLKFKSWLTLPDAAKHLSLSFEEEVTEADVLGFALEGHLKLSVFFVNPVKAMCGKVVGIEHVEWVEIPDDCVTEMLKHGEEISKFKVNENGKPVEMESIDIGDERFFNLIPEIATIYDVMDLPMISLGQLIVEDKYQELTGGPAVDFERHRLNTGVENIFIEDPRGQMFRLQAGFDDIDSYPGSKAQLAILNKRIKDERISDDKAEELLRKYSVDRQICQRDLILIADATWCFIAGSLPKDSVLVVRHNALREFERLNPDNEQKTEGKHKDRRRPAQIGLLLSVIDTLKIDRHNIMVCKKQDVLKECLKSDKVFSSESVFNRVWSELSVSGQISIEGKENFI